MFIEAAVSAHLISPFPYLILTSGVSRFNTYKLANIAQMSLIRTIWFRSKVHHGIYREVHGYCTCVCNDSYVGHHATQTRWPFQSFDT